ncbi:enoyl-CoA hydratase/isomerase family protein [Roseovarius sp. PS-C2]|uniref:enoyl-CoA hydratase/isomerase family protein n=1 Tax=Roseovarius sp. PS-C2 TaxID=2820814 RepID=UPI001C0B186E|nr:enoyl-CoA hydratase/isomerase family protein [Roseovarius sp. PS-C2]MBU3258463.1 enoyl-CoA hydratase/isomerase family protein [Roseovarius sp. PS-C2]
MSDEINIRKERRAGRITLTRPKALNALSYDMCLAMEDALDAWAADDSVNLVIVDAEGDKAFCAGGDIQKLYDTGRAGDFAFGRRFWRDEYRLNAKIAEYPKPYIAFMQGFTMGGGVGIACHGSHRIVCDSSQIAMPECGIGLVPDVGGSLLLANAPGRLGEYLGMTGTRMGPGDAIHAGFADHYLPASGWDALKAELIETGDATLIERAASPAPASPLAATQAEVDTLFTAETLPDLLEALESDDTEIAQSTLKKLSRNSPLSLACTLDMIHRLRATPSADIRHALDLEYRFTHRAMEHSDILEGIRAQIIDKDRQPNWQHDPTTLPDTAVSDMLAPLGQDALTFDKEG